MFGRVVGPRVAFALLAIVAMAALLSGPPAASARRDNIIHVGFLAPRGLTGTQTAAVVAALDSFANALSTGDGYLNAFDGCVFPGGGDFGNRPCDDISKLDVLISTSFGDPDKTTKLIPVTMIAGSLVDHRQTGQLTFPTPSLGTTDLWTAIHGLTLAQLQQLLGNPSLSNGAMTLSAYSPFLQLVPQTATDRKYLNVLAHHLAQQRIQTVPSQFTGIDTSPGGGGGGSGTPGGICQNSPRYLLYTVSMRQLARPLAAQTAIYAQGTGQIIDCADPATPLTFRSFDKAHVASTKGTISSVLGILSLAFVSHTNSWANAAAVGSGISSFVDTDPTSNTVEAAIYDASLHSLVTDMCRAVKRSDALDEAARNATPLPTPSPSPSPSPTPTPGRHVSRVGATRGEGGGAPAAGTGAAANPLGVGSLLVGSQPRLVCAYPAL